MVNGVSNVNWPLLSSLGQTMKPIRRTFAILAVILALQLLILVVFFQLIGPPTSPAGIAMGDISPEATELAKKDEDHSRLKRNLFFSHHVTGVDVAATHTENSKQAVRGNDLHRNPKHSLKEKQENRNDDELVQRKRSKEKFSKGETAPRKFNGPKGSENQGKDNNRIPVNVQIEKNSSDSKQVTGLKQAIVRDNATRKPVSVQRDSIELLGGKLRRNIPGRDLSSNTATRDRPKMSERKPDSRRVPRLPSKRPNEDSMEDSHELTDNWEQHQLAVVRAKNKIDGSVRNRLKMYNTYWKSLDVPGLSPDGSVEEYIKRIHGSAKAGNLTNYLKEYCNETAESLVECARENLRKPIRRVEEGRNIMYTLRTTIQYHDIRLVVLFETWLTTVYPGSVFLVTDGEDSDLEDQLLNIGELR